MGDPPTLRSVDCLRRHLPGLPNETRSAVHTRDADKVLRMESRMGQASSNASSNSNSNSKRKPENEQTKRREERGSER
jgi:hypothetical protein